MTFNGRTTSEEIVAGLDLTGKTVVITGTSAGLGYEAARVLAGAGAGVSVVARSPAKNAEAAARIIALNPDARLHLVTINLAEMASVRQGAAEILAAHPKIDVLINNAGIMGWDHMTSHRTGWSCTWRSIISGRSCSPTCSTPRSRQPRLRGSSY